MVNKLMQPPPDLWEKLKPLARQKRHEPTPAENRLWEHIRNRQIDNLKFRRQHPVDKFIVDFYCSDARLVIEVDGWIHAYTMDEDAIRQEFLPSLGIKVIRFTNDQVFQSLYECLEQIAVVGRERRIPSPPDPLSTGWRGGRGVR